MNTSNSITTINPRIRVEHMQEYPTGRDKTLISLDGEQPVQFIGTRRGSDLDLELWGPKFDPVTGVMGLQNVSYLLPVGITHDAAVSMFVRNLEWGLTHEAEIVLVAA